MFTELSLGSQMSPDNGLTHVSLKVSIKDPTHKSLFGFKELLLFRFTTWGIGGYNTSLHLRDLATLNRLLLKPSKYLTSFREGYAAISP